ncbi:uncharacterized protein LY79DRAFT_397355 [Colletotrichum navitas]|uniref:Uncharacterized protein n=1 Tax=Colletotrichum navitas TaxID=681940 RepID=A0AAD8PP50_9PEZI|nr:uncharacterized protein LY79DRAFT_397355 [Colletotrichum navitas]KAK1573805.1 hypothetical protein LY79DRAFT_397355 [Colletotrichum navitas]
MTVIPTYHIPVLSIPSITAHGKHFSLQEDRIGSQSKDPFQAVQLVCVCSKHTRPPVFLIPCHQQAYDLQHTKQPSSENLRNARNLNWEHISSDCVQPCDTNTTETEAGGSIPSVLLSEREREREEALQQAWHRAHSFFLFLFLFLFQKNTCPELSLRFSPGD